MATTCWVVWSISSSISSFVGILHNAPHFAHAASSYSSISVLILSWELYRKNSVLDPFFDHR